MNEQRKPDWDPRSKDVLQNQLAAYDDLRKSCPVAYSEFLQWSLFRHADVVRVLKDHETFSNAVSQHLSVPNGMDPPEHTPYRRMIDPYFSSERMEAFAPTCREIAAKLVRKIVEQGEVELMDDFAQPFAVSVQCAFLGWPDSLQEPLVRWTEKNFQATLARDRVAMADIAREFEKFTDDMLERHRRAGAQAGDDVTADLMHEQVWGRPLSNEELASLLRNWTVGEIGTISSAVGILAEYLARHPELQEQLRAEPSRLPTAIDEILRIHGPLVSSRRITTKPVEIGGRLIEVGERITLMWISANRDGLVFENPEEFRWDRDPSLNLLYGTGIHYCPGAPLARLELRIIMEELLGSTASIERIADQPATNATYPASGFATLPLRIQPTQYPLGLAEA